MKMKCNIEAISFYLHSFFTIPSRHISNNTLTYTFKNFSFSNRPKINHFLTFSYRLLYCYKLFEEKKYSPREMANELKLQDWQVNKLRKEANLYHKDDLKTILVDIFKLDLNIKSGRVDKVVSFYAFLIQVLEC